MSRTPTAARSPLTTLPGLGPKSAAWLKAADITTPEQLRELGAVEAYRAVAAQQPGVSLNLLWALFGALHNMHWTSIPPDIQAQLKAELDQDKSAQPVRKSRQRKARTST